MSRDEDFSGWAAEATPRLLRLGHLLAGERHAGEDLVQDVLERVYLRWVRIDVPDAYARRALVNAATSRWRLRGRHPETSWSAVPEPVEDSRQLAAVDDHSEIMAILRRLPVRQRAVVVLRYLHDCSEAETADILGISVGTVKSQHARALTRLRELGPASPSQPLSNAAVREQKDGSR